MTTLPTRNKPKSISKSVAGDIVTGQCATLLRTKHRTLRVTFTGPNADELHHHAIRILKGLTRPGNATVIYE